MAVIARVISKSLVDVYVKVSGIDGTSTLNLTTDLLCGSDELDGKTPEVNVMALFWTGDLGGLITIDRNNERLYSVQTNTVGNISLTENGFCPDNVNNTSDLKFTINSAQCELWVKLKKVAGFKAKPQAFMH